MLLTVLGPSGSEIAKEIVSTVELSQFGARLRGRRSFRPEAEGHLTQLRSGRQARVRIVWQRKSDASAGYVDTGVEILSGFDYWGISFSEPETAASLESDSITSSTGARELAVHEVLTELTDNNSGQRNLEALWCGLIEHLESRQVIHRDDLVAAIRNIAKLSNPKATAGTPS
jgi:hypothetical protein